MISPDDMAHCRATIRTGSLSFHAASRLLPATIRDPAIALYAFCRLADDEVDEGQAKARAVLALEHRLDRVYQGRPEDAPEDRAMAAIVQTYEMPRALPAALLEGLAWDAGVRRYRTLSDVRAYSARVAAAVGVMMCTLMRVRAPHLLARACDLGVAMQLTNIARDVGEDARNGRLYLPLDWFDEAGIDPDAFLANPTARPEIRDMVARLLAEANRLYRRSGPGIEGLPRDARMGIRAARIIYDGIGAEIRRNAFDSVTRRAHTTSAQKALWLAQAAGQSLAGMALPLSPRVFAAPLPETAFLVEAAGRAQPKGWGDALVTILADLKRQERDGTPFGAIER